MNSLARLVRAAERAPACEVSQGSEIWPQGPARWLGGAAPARRLSEIARGKPCAGAGVGTSALSRARFRSEDEGHRKRNLNTMELLLPACSQGNTAPLPVFPSVANALRLWCMGWALRPNLGFSARGLCSNARR